VTATRLDPQTTIGAVTQSSAFETACHQIGRALEADSRRQILDWASNAPDFAGALTRLRDQMRANVWRLAGGSLDIERIITKFDRKTRHEGFHVLNDWDGVSDTVNPDTIPVDVLHYVQSHRGADPVDRAGLAILLDYHFMHVLALLSLRVFDEGDADANLDRVGALLHELQGPAGSGQLFADDAETLILIATSHYELHERGYETLLAQVRRLNETHQLNIAVGHALSMGCHLRFGFEATYARDTVNMRDDNVADYPWLCYALATVMRAYERSTPDSGERHAMLVEALLNGLSGDARAFVGAAPPRSLSTCELERAEFASGFARHRERLLQEFEAFRPRPERYSPLSFYFNFSHNVVKGTVVDALLRSEPWPLTLNDLLTSLSRPGAPAADAKEALAATLMAYARANPHKIRGQLMPVIVYDPRAGREAFGVTLRKLRE
jgi:hypothetical protein